MNTKQVADLLGVQPNTVRRLAAEFHRYLSGSAHPPKGEVRIFTESDLRTLHYIQAERDLGRPYETIHAHLAAMEAAAWADLPDIPPEWKLPREVVPLVEAAARAHESTMLAVLQRDLEHATVRAELAESRVIALESDIAAQRALQTVTEGELRGQLHAAQLDLSHARGQVAELQARLSAYAITGGDKPIPIALIVLVTASAVAVLVIVLLIVVRLVL
jgi:DNA-binding transcriptional MerR regulator